MTTRTVIELAGLCRGTLLSGDGSTTVDAVSTDTRSLQGGELFLGLRGPNFDGGRFAPEAVEAGAAAVVIDAEPADPAELGSAAVIVVGDTLQALQDLARAERRREGFRVVGITGSSGKTTVKDMIAAVLRTRFRVVATKGNLNNHVGLPLSLLAATEADEVGVFEMGMNHAGEIAPLAEIAAPDIAVVTNIGTAHIEHLGTREAIAVEKAELLGALGPEGVGVIPADDDFADELAAKCPGRCLRAGEGGGDVRSTKLRESLDGVAFDLVAGADSAAVELPVPGRHMAANACLAAAVGLELGVPLADAASALSSVQLSGGRLERRVVDGIVYLDDSYNANPDSMAAAFRTLGGLAPADGGRRVAVVGRMAELGDRATDEHRALGRLAATEGIDVLFTVGEEPALAWETAANLAGQAFDDCSSCVRHLRVFLSPGDVVLVKGSRSSAMERVLEHLASSCSN